MALYVYMRSSTYKTLENSIPVGQTHAEPDSTTTTLKKSLISALPVACLYPQGFLAQTLNYLPKTLQKWCPVLASKILWKELIDEAAVSSTDYQV
jgi:hypothetical protein